MQILEKLRTAITKQEPEQPKEKVSFETQQPQWHMIIPVFARPQTPGTVSEKLYPKFCNCPTEPELLAFKGTVCLLGCSKPNCQKRLFRIDTA
jgi:hypothetical protein